MYIFEGYESFMLVVIFCISFVGLIVYSTFSIRSLRKLNSFKEKAYQWMLVAEKRYSFGDKKFIYVVENLYKTLPNRLKIRLSKDDVQKWVQQLYNEFSKEYLSDD